MKAAYLMLSVADKFKGNNNFEYDLVDVLRQALAEKGRLTLKIVSAAYKAEDKELFGFDVGDDYYDNEPEKDDEDVSHIIDAYVNVLEKLDNGEDVDFNSIVF
jgi:hypothetical protein